MVTRQLMVLASVFATLVGGAVMAKAQEQYIRVAHIEIDPAQIEAYKAAVSEEIESSVRLEPGVLALYAVSDKDNSAQITVFEIYADESAYKAHLETPHFLKYKSTTQDMVKSLKLAETVPVMIGVKH